MRSAVKTLRKNSVQGSFLCLSTLFYQSLFLISSLLFIAACDSDEKKMKLKNEQVASLEKKIKGLTGNRHPDCWQDEKGKYEFIYNIILRDKGITTYRGYKKYLEQKFQEIPGANNIIGTKNISIREFKQKTRSVFNWSVKTAKPECRHWVRIFDETSSSNRSTYKIPLHGIENYFFKKEYRMTYSEFKKILASPSNIE